MTTMTPKKNWIHRFKWNELCHANTAIVRYQHSAKMNVEFPSFIRTQGDT